MREREREGEKGCWGKECEIREDFRKNEFSSIHFCLLFLQIAFIHGSVFCIN